MGNKACCSSFDYIKKARRFFCRSLSVGKLVDVNKTYCSYTDHELHTLNEKKVSQFFSGVLIFARSLSLGNDQSPFIQQLTLLGDFAAPSQDAGLGVLSEYFFI